MAPSTRRAYEGTARGFLDFAKACGHRSTWPMEESVLLQYLAELREKGVAPGTMRVHLSSLSFFSKALGQWDPGSSFLACRAVEGWRRMAPPRRDSRRPITARLLRQVVRQLPLVCLSRFETVLAAAAFTVAFFGAFRCSELLAPARWSASSHAVAINDVEVYREHLVITLRHSKTDQRGRGSRITLHRSHHREICPVRNMQAYLSVRPLGQGGLFVHQDGTSFSRYQFGAVLKRCLRGMGVCTRFYSAHSFRIGAATQAHRQGASPRQIMRLGRWRSGAYKGYVRPVQGSNL
ncbi:integrase/recombinase xerD homolog [Paroedura picta]|uniref:integrase/recombinase xerD homolog n=1 Tax=Paroedura picta TaxID=143630 RepID=UPI004055B14C